MVKNVEASAFVPDLTPQASWQADDADV